MGRIRIGIGGWTYAPWRGVFYPDKHPQAKELEYASRQLGAIEINATFYGRQKPKSWETWANIVPDDFQFAIKGSRYCVSRSKLAESADSIANFFAQGFAVLGPKLGPILWQFAHFKRFDRDDIARVHRPASRDAGWDQAPARDRAAPRELRRRAILRAVPRAQHRRRVRTIPTIIRRIEADTADFAYARLQRMSEEIPTGYDDAAIDRFAARAREWREQGAMPTSS